MAKTKLYKQVDFLRGDDATVMVVEGGTELLLRVSFGMHSARSALRVSDAESLIAVLREGVEAVKANGAATTAPAVDHLK